MFFNFVEKAEISPAHWAQWPLFLNYVKREGIVSLTNHSCRLPRNLKNIRQNKLSFPEATLEKKVFGQENKFCAWEEADFIGSQFF